MTAWGDNDSVCCCLATPRIFGERTYEFHIADAFDAGYQGMCHFYLFSSMLLDALPKMSEVAGGLCGEWNIDVFDAYHGIYHATPDDVDEN